MYEIDWFLKIAEYLKDPLVLSGFVVFVGFLALKQLLKSGVIPELRQVQGYRILRLVLSYGFIIGLLIVILGMGLKYREMSIEEQQRAVSQITNELATNSTMLGELVKNSDTLSDIVNGVAKILRDDRFKILSGLFPAQNMDPMIDASQLTNLYIDRINWLTNSNLWMDQQERRRTEEVCESIIRFSSRTHSTVKSLSDVEMRRYVVQKTSYEANQSAIRKISIVAITDLAELYREVSEVRIFYDRIVSGVIEYVEAIKSFCQKLPPDRASLSAALASERIALRLLPTYRARISSLVAEIEQRLSKVKLRTEMM